MPPQNNAAQNGSTAAATPEIPVTMPNSKEKIDEVPNFPGPSNLPPQTTQDVPYKADLIDTMNDLQGKLVASGHSLDVPLPQIVVVGSQSAGKSSVMENIVGKEFLPRGKGVVTTRPILIQLFPYRGEEYGVFGDKPEDKIYDFAVIKREIEAQMPKASKEKGGKSFSSVPIQLQIYSSKVLKLTLVDLPGLVRVAIDGQPEDTITEVKEMVLKYINQPECLILAVSPANQDLATSDALEIARTVDPTRERTIGVITKLDLMDQGTDARKILDNQQIQLKRGYIGVLNRSQKDIEDGKDIEYILEKERKFFREEPAYRHMAHRMGTPYLRQMLQKTLRLHIKAALPDMRSKISEKLTGLDKQLCELTEKMGGGGEGKQFYMLRVVHAFIEDVRVKIMGHSVVVDTSNLTAGALINYKLNTEVVANLRLNLVPKAEDLTVLIKNIDGIRGSLSFPTLALDSICQKLVGEYVHPLKSSVDCIKKVLEESMEKSAGVMNGYPSMRSEILYRIHKKISEEAENTFKRLKDHVSAEKFYVNLEHPDLDLSVCDTVVPSVGLTKVWEAQPENAPAEVDSNSNRLVGLLMQNESIQQKVEYIMLVMTKYLEIVQKQMCDLAIKYIVTFLIKRVLDYMTEDLIPSILGSPNFGKMTEDCDEDFRQKEDMERTAKCLREALDAIQNF